MGPYGGYVLKLSIKIPTRKFTKADYDFLRNLHVDENDKNQLELLADKVRGMYFETKDEGIELKDELKTNYNLLTRAIKEKRKVKIIIIHINTEIWIGLSTHMICSYIIVVGDVRHFANCVKT